MPFYALTLLPGRGKLATVDFEKWLHWLDTRTLADIATPTTNAGSPLWSSPDGQSFAYPAMGGAGARVRSA